MTSLFPGTPQIVADTDTGGVNLGTEFYSSVQAWITHLRYLFPSSGGGTSERYMTVYNADTQLSVITPVLMPNGVDGTWCELELLTPFEMVANQRYRVVTWHSAGKYAAESGYFDTGGSGANTTTYDGYLTVVNRNDAVAQKQGSYFYAGTVTFPDAQFGAASYFSNVIATNVDPAATAQGSASGTVSFTGSASGETPGPIETVMRFIDPAVAEALTTDPPTTSVNYASSTTIAGGTLVQPDDAAISLLGAGLFERGAAFPDTLATAPRSKYPRAWSNPGDWSFELTHTGTEIEFIFKCINASAAGIRIMVDGQPVTTLAQTPAPGGTPGNRYTYKLTWGSSRARHIRVEHYLDPFSGFYVANPAEITAAPAVPFRLMGFGDSITNGSSESSGGGIGTWLSYFGRYVQTGDVWDAAIGSTGYLENGTSINFAGRVADITDFDPEALIIWGGYNDATTSIDAASATFFSNVKAGVPGSTEIYVGGFWCPKVTPDAYMITRNNELRTAALNANLPFVDMINGEVVNSFGTIILTTTPWIADAGQVTAYIGGDNVHPTDAGHQYLATRWYEALEALTWSGGYSSGSISFTGSASGSTPTKGSAAGALSFTGSAVGSIQTEGSASGTAAWNGAASGASDNQGSASGTFSFVGSASGGSDSDGSASGAFSFVGAASGARDSDGSASGVVSWTGSVSGASGSGGSASGAFSFVGAVSGASDNQGSAAGAVSWTGTALGGSAQGGPASGSFSWTGSAAGATDSQGSSAGAVSWVGSVAGSADLEGSASGSFSFVGSANGASGTGGSAAGSVSWIGSAAGARDSEGQGSGSVSWVGSASGSAPTVGANSGTAAGSVSWTGSASGNADRSGSASGAFSWTGSVSGGQFTNGSVTGSLSFSGSASGKRSPYGSVAGALAFTGAVAGAADYFGTASGSFDFVGDVIGGSVFRDITITLTAPQRYGVVIQAPRR